jgi:hypothetical protein
MKLAAGRLFYSISVEHLATKLHVFYRSGALLGVIQLTCVRYRCAKRCFRSFGEVETDHISSTSEPDF